jgi:uncharacterized protein
MEELPNRPYFFDSGIFFECLRCGRCCTGDPGVVQVSRREIETIAGFLKIPVSGMIRDFIRPHKGSFSIREDELGRCFFYDEGCRIYPVRPMQCVTFPFWFSNLRSEQRWREVEHQCPGIGKGAHFSKEIILKLLSSRFSG